MTELKPCPFCGGEAKMCENATRTATLLIRWVRCTGCGVETTANNKPAAIAAWNRRASAWISVEERLPEKNLLVVAWHEGYVWHHGDSWRRYGIKFAVHRGDKGWSDRLMQQAEHELDASCLAITHWMPLPEPPEVPDG